ncbi:hypothetical protein KC721_03730 [Candidatus Woesebacteria bacterium]|nr:hypothetical protein [Candidatus Woesebacteria bacterium]
MAKHPQQTSPLQTLMQATSDFLVGFSVFLIISGLIGTVFVLQDLQENTSQDVRSDASTATPQVEIATTEPICQTLDVCLSEAIEGQTQSCSPTEICEIPPGCYLETISCFREPCDVDPQVVICPERLDDIFFFVFNDPASPGFYTDEAMTQEVSEESLEEGNRYFIKSQIEVQNVVKNSLPSDLSFSIRMKVNESLDSVKLAKYNMLTEHRDGYADILSGPFTAKRNNIVAYEVGSHDNNGNILIPETNYDNNKHLHTFSAQACANNPDLNNDNKVDLRDFSILSREFFKTGTNTPADINCDGTVNILDYSILATNFSVTK